MLSRKIYEMDKVSLQPIFNRIPLLKYRHLGSFPFDYVRILPNETFAVKSTQPSNMQGEHWIMISKFRHELYSADSLGRKSNVSSGSITSSWCQHNYCAIPVMQLFISSSSVGKKLLEFKILMYYVLEVIICIFFNNFILNMQSIRCICSNLYSLIYFSKL